MNKNIKLIMMFGLMFTLVVATVIATGNFTSEESNDSEIITRENIYNKQICETEELMIPDPNSKEEYPEIILANYTSCERIKEENINDYLVDALLDFTTPTYVNDSKMIDTDILSASSIYTKSKTIEPDTDYASIFQQDISKKDTHYSIEDISGQKRLNMESRIVALEGAMQQIITESCIHYHKYSWCEK